MNKDGAIVTSSITLPPTEFSIPQTVVHDDVLQTKLPLKLVKGAPWIKNTNKIARSPLNVLKPVNDEYQTLVPLPKNFKLVKASPQTIAKIPSCWKLTTTAPAKPINESKAPDTIYEDTELVENKLIASSNHVTTATMSNLQSIGIKKK